jgi:hypothetical protein
LRERECELEVERIAAEAALTAAPAEDNFGLELDVAAELGEALKKKRHLEAVLARLDGHGAETGPSSGHEQLRAAKEALLLWLEAPKMSKPPRLPRIAHGVLLVIALIVVWAALAVHPALLVVLVGLAIPLAFLSSSNQDLQWLRLGAERRFNATGVRPPRDWAEAAVRERVLELTDLLESLASREETAEDRERTDSRREVVAAELAQASAQLDDLLVAAGVDAAIIDEEVERWLELARAAHRTRERLEKVKRKREALRAEVEGGREQVFRFLSRQGRAPVGGNADLEALDAGLKRLAAQPPTGVPTDPSKSGPPNS